MDMHMLCTVSTGTPDKYTPSKTWGGRSRQWHIYYCSNWTWKCKRRRERQTDRGSECGRVRVRVREREKHRTYWPNTHGLTTSIWLLYIDLRYNTGTVLPCVHTKCVYQFGFDYFFYYDRKIKYRWRTTFAQSHLNRPSFSIFSFDVCILLFTVLYTLSPLAVSLPLFIAFHFAE